MSAATPVLLDRKETIGDRPAGSSYVYRCVDRSLLVRPFCTYVVRPLMVWLPVGLPANFVTLISSLCMWILLGLALAGLGESLATWSFALMAAYVVYDHADGMQARRARISSPLGEYLDHFLDAFHATIAVAVVFVLAGRATHPLFGVVIAAVLLASAATMVEQRERGELYFGLLGPLEGMLLVLGFFASWCWPGAGAWWAAPVVGELTRFDAVLMGGVCGSLATFVVCVIRIGRLPWTLGVYAAGSALLATWLGRHDIDWRWTLLLLTLHGSDYVGRVIVGHLVRAPRPVPDLIAPVLAGVALAAETATAPILCGLGAYLLVQNARATAMAWSHLRRHWRWWHAAPARAGQ